MKKRCKFLYFGNQFFGRIGSADDPNQPPSIKADPIKPVVALADVLKDEAEILATIICGDKYFAENQREATEEILSLAERYIFDGVIAGPAFNHDLYGIACGAVCKAMKERFNVPAVTAMFSKNIAVELYKKDVLILKTEKSAGAGLKSAIPRLAAVALKLQRGEGLGFPEDEGYFPQGYKVNVWVEESGARRAVDMLMKRMRGEPFVTEIPLATFEKVPSAAPISNLSSATIALVTTGGIVPKGNPDHIQSANADTYGRYSIAGLDDLVEGEYECANTGYNLDYANADPDRVLPLDVMRILEKGGVIGSFHDYYYATVGSLTSVSNSTRFGEEIGRELREHGVHGVILTST